MTQVLVAAGSNIEPERQLAVAMRDLAREFPGVRFSTAYRNAAVGFEGEDFINLVAAFDSVLPPAAILERLEARDIEREAATREVCGHSGRIGTKQAGVEHGEQREGSGKREL